MTETSPSWAGKWKSAARNKAIHLIKNEELDLPSLKNLVLGLAHVVDANSPYGWPVSVS